MGKSIISMAIFNSYVKLPEGMYSYVRLRGINLTKEMHFSMQQTEKPAGLE